MEIRKVPISLLNAAPYNPRKDLQPGDPEYQKIARSIEKYGCVEPIIWNEKTGNVIGGHQRLKVLAATGAVEVDVSVVQLSLEDEKALNLALNLLGCYVHDMRLQFLEFFGRFYKDGGKAYRPLRVRAKHVEIIKEDTKSC